MMDIYIWSIEDRHEVRVEAYGVRLSVACFSNAQVARNFRAWLAELPGLDALMRDLVDGSLTPVNTLIWDYITVRRQHPAQVYVGHGLGCIVILNVVSE